MDIPKSSSDSISTPTDENDYDSHEEISVSKNSALPQNKHYMSPTISTSSKANPPRRKVLAERNEHGDSHLLQRLSLDSPNMDIERSGFGEEGSSQSVYDPVTNYLTPRPKFLCYDPNKRLEILSRLGDCGEEDGESGSCSGDESSWSQEDDVSQESEDEFEEVEEKCCGLKGLMNLLVCLIGLVLSTSYISSMNSPMPSPVAQAVSGCKDEYHKIQDHVCEFMKNFDCGKCYLVQRECIELVHSDDIGIQQDRIESVGNVALEDLDERGEVIKDLEFLEDEDNAEEVNMSELENGVLYQELNFLEVTEEEEVTESENTTSSSPPDSTFVTETEVDKAMLANESVVNEVETSSKGEIIDSITTMPFLVNSIGGFVLSLLVLAALYFQKRRNDRHVISQAVEPSFKQMQGNNGSLVLVNEVDPKLKNSESSDSSKSFLKPIMDRDFDEAYLSRAPSIQLLGEFSVQEMSSSHRSYGMRDRILGSELSDHSVSVETVKNTKVYPSPLLAHSIFSEISSRESPYQKNIVTTSETYAEGKSRKPVTTTPLRRSSRISGRSIKSPQNRLRMK